MTRGHRVERIVVFAAVSLAVSFLTGLALAAIARGTGEVPLLLRETSLAVPFGAAVVLCALVGAPIGVWLGRSIVMKCLAVLICFAAPYAVMVAGSVSCLWWWECLR
jgi:hypothetical protein